MSLRRVFSGLAAGLALFLLLPNPAPAAGLSGAERRMVATVDAGQERQLALLEELVAIGRRTDGGAT